MQEGVGVGGGGGGIELGPSIKAVYNQGLSFENQDTFFDFQKEQGRPPLSSLVQHIKVWLNFHQYPYIFQNILENV